MAKIELKNITKAFNTETKILDDISLTIEDGEYFLLLGPSGSGKSTLLRIIAGLEDVSDGEILIGDKDVTSLNPKQRDIAFVFQNYALYPNLKVRENISFPLVLQKLDKKEIKKKVKEVAEVLGLTELLDRKPGALSGGQRQRVAMGRALVRTPQAFLLDEPLSNLDSKLRVSLRAMLSALHSSTNRTFVQVTHDFSESFSLADRIAVLADGKLQQVGSPHALYNQPANLFVAAFVGTPSINLAKCNISGDKELKAEFGSHGFKLPQKLVENNPKIKDYVGKELILGIRPSSFEDSTIEDAPRGAHLKAKVFTTEDQGSEVNILVEIDVPKVVTEHNKSLVSEAEEDSDKALGLGKNKSIWTARVSPKTRVREGDEVNLNVNTSELYFFDPDSGEAVGHPVI